MYQVTKKLTYTLRKEVLQRSINLKDFPEVGIAKSMKFLMLVKK